MIFVEDCLHRIASRLCQLEAKQCLDGEGSADNKDNSATADSKPPLGTCADACCRPAVSKKDDDSTDTCCKPSLGRKEDNCTAAGSELSIETSKDGANVCGTPTVSKKDDGCADTCCKPSLGSKEDKCSAAGSKLSVKTSNACPDACCKSSISGRDDDCADDCCEPPVKTMHDCAETNIECTDDCCGSDSQNASMELPSSCEKHLQAAFARFEALIRQGQCLCRRLMSEFNFCCCAQGDVACGSHTDNKTHLSTQLSECKTELFSQTPRASAAKDHGTSIPLQAVAVQSTSKDAESGAAREQVVLNVDGMTCTGCSKKLFNVLDGISEISNPKVTFVSGTASFELEHRNETMGLENVLSLIERQTGFKLSRVISEYQHVDVLIKLPVAQQLEREPPDGLVSVEKVCLFETQPSNIIIGIMLRY